MREYTILLVQAPTMENLLQDLYIEKISSNSIREAIFTLVLNTHFEIIVNYLVALEYNVEIHNPAISEIANNFRREIYNETWYNDHTGFIADLIYNNMQNDVIKII